MRFFAAQNTRKKHLAAQTLAEVMVGVAMMGILFTSLYGGMSSGFAVTQAARENLRATQIMLERMEGVRLYNWNQLVYSNWIPSSFTNWYYPMTNPGEAPGIMYVGSMQATNTTFNESATYCTNMKTIVVTINWVSAGVARTRSMTSYVANHGVQNYVYNN